MLGEDMAVLEPAVAGPRWTGRGLGLMPWRRSASSIWNWRMPESSADRLAPEPRPERARATAATRTGRGRAIEEVLGPCEGRAMLAPAGATIMSRSRRRPALPRVSGCRA